MPTPATRGWRWPPQSTGHLGQALPSLERTLLLKTALHDGEVEVDPVDRTARIKAGARWGDVVEAVAPHGLAVMHGSSPSVGVTGYLLGGGLSFYGRKHGLAVNHVRALEVVTPDGVHRHVDAEHNRDLFCALRGGGGGYAIVTAVEIGLLPYTEVTGGALYFAATDARRVLRAWPGWTAQAPDDITTTFRVLNLPPLPEVPEPLQGVTSICVDGVALDAARPSNWSPPALRGQPDPRWLRPDADAAIPRLHGDPEEPVPGIGDGMLLEKLDDWAIEASCGPRSRLAAARRRDPASRRRAGGAARRSGRPRSSRGALPAVRRRGSRARRRRPPCSDAYLDRYLDAMAPWATGTRFRASRSAAARCGPACPTARSTRLSRIRAARRPRRHAAGVTHAQPVTEHWPTNDDH